LKVKGSFNQDNLTLGEIDQGNLILRSNKAIADVIRDIADPNKQATKPREVTVKIKFTPEKSRKAAEVSYSVSSKPAPHVESKSDIYLGKDSLGEPIAKPWLPNQQEMPFVEEQEKEAAAS
jgi:hypothetical protein